MLRSLERTFKRLLAFVLRGVLGSRAITLPPNPDVQRILVIRQHNQLGDMLCVVPLLRGLRKRFSTSHITLMASPVNAEVMQHSPYLDEVLLYDKREFLGKGIEGWQALWRYVKSLRIRNSDLVIVPTTVSTSFTSDLLAYLSGARYRIGTSSLNGRENPSAMFFNLPVALDWRNDASRHQTLRNLDVARILGIDEEDLRLHIGFNAQETEHINSMLHNKKAMLSSIVVYHPGAGKVPNRWQATRFAQVANALREQFSCTTVITCGPMDERPVYDMIAWLKGPYQLVKGKTIREVASILAVADLVITNDTGIMHVAGAVGVPVLSLFGPTEPEQWAPPGEKNRFIRGRRNDINTISVDEVLSVARELLKSSKR